MERMRMNNMRVSCNLQAMQAERGRARAASPSAGHGDDAHTVRQRHPARQTAASHAPVHAAIMYVRSPGDTRRHRAFRATPPRSPARSLPASWARADADATTWAHGCIHLPINPPQLAPTTIDRRDDDDASCACMATIHPVLAS